MPTKPQRHNSGYQARGEVDGRDGTPLLVTIANSAGGPSKVRVELSGASCETGGVSKCPCLAQPSHLQSSARTTKVADPWQLS
jgi:hypothetical protein